MISISSRRLKTKDLALLLRNNAAQVEEVNQSTPYGCYFSHVPLDFGYKIQFVDETSSINRLYVSPKVFDSILDNM